MDSLYVSQCTTIFLLFYCVPFKLRDSTQRTKTSIFNLNFDLIITQDKTLIRGIPGSTSKIASHIRGCQILESISRSNFSITSAGNTNGSRYLSHRIGPNDYRVLYVFP
jgi:hypothetical protein